MNYLPQNRKKRNLQKLLLPALILAVFLGLIILLNFTKPNFFSGLLQYGKPLWKFENFVSAKSSVVVGVFSSKKNLINKNEALKKEIQSEQLKSLNFSVLEGENRALKKILGRTDSENHTIASILVKPPQSFYDKIILDAGSNLGVKVGDKIFSIDNAIIGEVIEVYRSSSKARLFSSVGQETQGLIARNNITVTIIGKGGGNFEIRLPQETDVVKGDVIILPGMFYSILGSVIEIESNVTNSFKKVLFRSPVNVSELRWVTIETKQEKNH